MAADSRPFRDEPDTLYVWRDGFANMRVGTSRPIGTACTVYRKERVLPAGKVDVVDAELPRLDRMARTGRTDPVAKRKAPMARKSSKKK